MKDKNIDYDPIIVSEGNGPALDFCSGDSSDSNGIENFDGVYSTAKSSKFELERGIDHNAVGELVVEINELRKGLLILLLLFITIAGAIALDDYISNKEISVDDGVEKITPAEEALDRAYPHSGHKLQINVSAFTVNDFECLQLDTGKWPSERVHCELRKFSEYDNSANDDDDIDDVAQYDFVVEHFDDDNCQQPNAENPIIRHTASGCYYFKDYNHSYNDMCHMNRTLTISAFNGPGCLVPMPVTAVNILMEDMQ